MNEPGDAQRASVRVVLSVDPATEAASVAAEIGADVVADLRAAEQAVRQRVEAGRRALGDPAGDDAILARAEEVRAEAARPPALSDDQVAELQGVARDLTRAARIRRRTEARFAESLHTRLATTSGVALHPEAIRAAADAVVGAEEALAAAAHALTEHDDAAGADAEAASPSVPSPPPKGPKHVRRTPVLDVHEPGDADLDPVLQRPHDVFDELALDKRRAVTRGLAVFLVLAGGGVALLALGNGTLGIALVAIAVAAGIAVVAQGARSAHHEEKTRVSATSRLDGLVLESPPAPAPEPVTAIEAGTAAFDDGPGPAEGLVGVADDLDEADDAEALAAAEAAAEEEELRLVAARDEAAERLRVAEARWRQLVGPDADAHDPDPVVRANDPQLTFDPQFAEGSPTVRTVAAFHRAAQARWRVLWASLGREAPEPEQLDATLADLLGEHHQARAALQQLDAAEARVAARTTVARALVLQTPSRWITTSRLSQLLASVPPEGQVVVVELDDRAVAAIADTPH